MSDRELIDEIITNNSQNAFRQLVERYQPHVTRTCLGFVANTSDAEDIAQEVFIEIYQSLGKFRNESKLSTWIYRIAVNKSINQLRKQKRDRMLRSIENFFAPKGDGSDALDIEGGQDSHADRDIEKKENKLILKNAINQLPENQRIAFILSKYQELSYKEISEVMDVTLSSVESLLFRAKSNLQKEIVKSLKK